MPDRRPEPGQHLSRLVNRARARGAAEIVDLATGRVKETLSSRNTLILNVLPAEPIKRSAEGLTFRAATQDDAEMYARDIGTDSASTFSARLADDVRCYLVEGDDKLLHSSWVTTSAAWAREIAMYLTPPRGDAYVYESFTRADARGRGIYPFALGGIVTALAAERIERVWVGVEATNLASRRAMEKAGFEEGFRVEFGRNLGRLWVGAPVGREAEIGREFLRRGLETNRDRRSGGTCP